MDLGQGQSSLAFLCNFQRFIQTEEVEALVLSEVFGKCLCKTDDDKQNDF